MALEDGISPGRLLSLRRAASRLSICVNELRWHFLLDFSDEIEHHLRSIMAHRPTSGWTFRDWRLAGTAVTSLFVLPSCIDAMPASDLKQVVGGPTRLLASSTVMNRGTSCASMARRRTLRHAFGFPGEEQEVFVSLDVTPLDTINSRWRVLQKEV